MFLKFGHTYPVSEKAVLFRMKIAAVFFRYKGEVGCILIEYRNKNLHLSQILYKRSK